MEILNAYLFGKFHVKCNNKINLNLDNGRTQELFSYLLLHRDQPLPREALADLLWNDTETQQAKRYLSKTLWQLRSALSSQSHIPCDTLLSVEPGWIQLNSSTNLWLDVAMFEEAYIECHVDLKNVEVNHLVSGVDIYQGELLTGFYHSWCLYARERFKLMLLAMLERLMDYHEAQEAYPEGLNYGFRLLEEDQVRERTHRRLMRLYYLVGDRTAALRQYEQCASILQEELSVEPGRRTKALFHQICEDAPSLSPGKILTVRLPQQLVAVDEPAVRMCLQRIHNILCDTQRRVTEEIDTIETILKPVRLTVTTGWVCVKSVIQIQSVERVRSSCLLRYLPHLRSPENKTRYI